MQNVIQTGKRALSVAVAATTMLFSVGAGLLQPSVAAAATAGDLIKGTSLSTVYYYGYDGMRYTFPNEKTYMTWYSDFSGVQTISDSALADLSLAGNVVYRPGSSWIKVQSDDKVYAVSTDGSIHWIESEAVASAFAGSSWASRVQDVPDVFFTDYTVGSSLMSATAFDGMMYMSGGNYYVVTGTTKQMVSAAGRSANRLQDSFFLTGTGIIDSSLTAGADITGAVSSLMDAAQNVTTTSTTTTSAITASLSSSSPASGIIVQGQALADLAHFTLSGTGTLNSVTVTRSGISDQNTLTNMYLFDGATRLTDGYSFNSTGTATFTGLSLAMSGSKELSVKADVCVSTTSTCTTGLTIAVWLTGATFSGSSAATLSVAGNTMTLASGSSLASAWLSSNTVSSASVNAGTTAYTVWSAPLQVNTRSLWLKGANFRLTGSAPTDSLSNIMMYVDGVAQGSAATIGSINGSDYVMFNTSSAPITLSTGSHTISVRANVEKGSSYTVVLSLALAADLMLTDSQLGVNVATLGAAGAAFAANTAGTITINSGSVTTVVDSSFNSQTNVSGGASNTTIGKFTVHAYGEDVKVNSLTVAPTITTSGTTASTGTASIAAVVAGSAGLTSTISGGTVSSIAVATAGAGYTAAPTVTLTAPGVASVTLVASTTGDRTGATVTASGGSCTTLPTATVAFTGTNPSSVTLLTPGIGCTSAPTWAFTFTGGTTSPSPLPTLTSTLGVQAVATAAIASGAVSSYTVSTAGTGYGVAPTVTVAAPSFGTVGGMNNVTLYFNGSQVGSQQNLSVAQTALSFTPGSQMIVPAGTDSTVEVRADLVTTTSVAYTAGTLATALNIGSNNAEGQTSKTLVNVPTATTTTQSLTVQTGNLAISANTAYASQTATPNTTGVKIGSYVLQNQSSSESVRVTTLSLNVTATSITNFSSMYTSETSGNASTPIQPVSGVNTFSADFTLAPGASKTIDIFANSSSATSGTIATTLAITSIGVTSNVSTTSSAATGQTITMSAGAVTNPPTVVTSSSTTAQYIAAAGGATDAVTASYNFLSTGGASTITELKFTVTGTAASPVSSIKVGSASAQPVGGVAYLTGLSLAVPNGGSGLTQNVLVSYSTVGTTGVIPNTTAIVSLTYVKYTSGTTTTTFSPDPSGSPAGIEAPTMTLVGSKPTVSVSSTVGSGLVVGGAGKIGEVTVAADAKGDIKVRQIVFTIASSGFSTAPTAISSASLKDGSTTLTDFTCTPASLVVTCITGATYATDYTITAGTSKTFSLYGTNNGANTGSGTPTITASVGQSTFTWDDTSTSGTTSTALGNVSGGTAGLNGTLIYNFPTTSYSIK